MTSPMNFYPSNGSGCTILQLSQFRLIMFQ